MEMLIVVAIIAILVAIAIPAFSGQLEKAREAADMANIRSAYAEVVTTALTSVDGTKPTSSNVKYNTTGWYMEVKATQKQAGWQCAKSGETTVKIGDLDVEPSTKGWRVYYSDVDGKTSVKATK